MHALIDVIDPGHRNEMMVLAVPRDSQVSRSARARKRAFRPAGGTRDNCYTVVQAAGPSEALQQLTLHPKIALLLTDIIMPEMNGKKARGPRDRTQTGPEGHLYDGLYAKCGDPQRLPGCRRAFLPKPFSIEQLANKVKQVLDS